MRRILRWVRRLCFALLLPLLLLLGAVQWWWLPRMNEYREQLAATLSHALHIPVSIAAMSAAIDDGKLALQLRDLRLYQTERDVTLAHFERALVVLHLWQSLHEWRPVIAHIRLEGANLTVEPALFAQLHSANANANTNAHSPEQISSAVPEAIWLVNLPRIQMVGEQLALRLPHGQSLQLSHPYLQFNATAHGQSLALTVDLPSALGERLVINVERLAIDGSWRAHGAIDLPKPHQRITFNIAPYANGWRLGISEARAEYLLGWALPWLDQATRDWLKTLDPQGLLPQIAIESEAGQYRVRGALQAVSIAPLHGFPGLTNLSGQLQFSTAQGELILNSQAVTVDTAGLLRAPIRLETVRGTLQWERDAQQLLMKISNLELANPDWRGEFWGQIRLPERGEAWLELQSRYRDVNVSQARHYLPVKVIPPAGMAWLDQALVSGKVTSGEMLLRGAPSAFPFDKNQGLFETRFQVEDAVLDYQTGWPRLLGLQAEVKFRNRGLQVVATRGRLLDGHLERATAKISDLSEVLVEVQGRAKGPAASLWRVLQDSPIGQEMRDELPNLQVSGSSNLDLELSIPTDTRPTQVRGKISFLNNDLNLSDWNVAFERLRGETQFTERGFSGRNLQGLWRGQPMYFDLELAGAENRRELRTQLRGRFGLGTLAGKAAEPLSAYISGQSDWKAVFSAPLAQGQRRGLPDFMLDIQSDLRGMRFDLPEPFSKPAEQAQALRIVMRPLDAERLAVNMRYGDEVRAALALQNALGNAPRLERGELRIATGEATLPEVSGLVVFADLAQWSWPNALASATPLRSSQAKSERTGFESLAGLRELQATIGTLNLAGQKFDGVTVNATRSASSLRIDVNSAGLAGRLTVPDQPSNAQPLNAALQRAHLAIPQTPATTVVDEPINPHQVPPFVLTVADLQLDERNLGRLRLIAMPSPQGLELSSIELNSTRQQVSGSGSWRWQGAQPRSKLQGVLHSPALAGTLADFGYPKAGIARAPTQAKLDVQWGGSPTDFAVEKLVGRLEFSVGAGQFLEIKPGFGRLIGLFSVQNLSRRLSLDFSDLFQPGASFDSIIGQTDFQHGQAQNQLRIEAPAAQVEMQGRIGLADQDYDQKITVTPRLGGTLPIAGALAGGPVTGVAVFVAERLFQKSIEKVTRHDYRLHGSWDKPVLEPLQPPPTPSNSPSGFTSER